MNNRRQILFENGIYILIWILLIFMPFVDYNGEESLVWQEAKWFWVGLIPYLILFLVNNYLLIPRLLLKKRYGYYTLSILVLLVVLFALLPLKKPFVPHGMPPWQKTEIMDSIKPPFPAPPHFGRAFGDTTFFRPPPGHRELSPEYAFKKFPHKPPPFRWGLMFGGWMLAILLISFNIAIRYVFKSFRDEQKLKELGKENLRAELNYLKAQINPHFFMNTLNNIHALIDIDQTKAKGTVIELSRIMRYVLYDTDKETVSLQKEIDLLENYISLMRIRYTDDVSITTKYPKLIPDVSIPPLIMISLVENAFKHGISYRKGSYIHTEMFITDGRLTYVVRNSLAAEPHEKTGMGLENLRKRLTLLYGERFTLQAAPQDDEYVAVLSIPIE